MKIIIILLVILPTWSFAQEYSRKEIDVTQIAEDLYGLPDMDLNYEELYENLVQLISSPLNLNKASVENFRFLKMLSESQIQHLIQQKMEILFQYTNCNPCQNSTYQPFTISFHL